MLTCAHPAWKSTSAPLFSCTSGKETVENLKISHGQLAPCQENLIKRQRTVSSTGCKVLASNAGFLLASMPSYCRFRPIECSYSQSFSVSVPQDKIRGSAIEHPCGAKWSGNRCAPIFHLRQSPGTAFFRFRRCWLQRVMGWGLGQWSSRSTEWMDEVVPTGVLLAALIAGT